MILKPTLFLVSVLVYERLDLSDQGTVLAPKGAAVDQVRPRDLEHFRFGVENPEGFPPDKKSDYEVVDDSLLFYSSRNLVDGAEPLVLQRSFDNYFILPRRITPEGQQTAVDGFTDDFVLKR
jgi:hypothetical protein